MSAAQLPPDGSFIEMTSYGETTPEVRVVRASGTRMTLSMALAHVPPTASTVELRWAAPPRGRMSQEGFVIAVDGNRIDVRFTGRPAVLQSRSFVRGGGGEAITMIRDGQEPVHGLVHDMSERAVRAHFTDIELAAGEEMILRIALGDEEVAFPATSFKVSSMRQQVPADGPLSVEMVALFEEKEKDDNQAKIVRRYIMHHQLLARNRGS